MKLFIQNMVTECSKKVVANELIKLNLKFTCLELGEVNLLTPIESNQRNQLKMVLHEYGLELMDNEKSILSERIVSIIIDLIFNEKTDFPAVKFSVYLSNALKKDYRYLSELFSRTKGITIEHYIILCKIERVKELIIYDELNISEISYRLNYSSVAHLSNQFKKVAGVSPSSFKKMDHKSRAPLENLLFLPFLDSAESF